MVRMVNNIAVTAISIFVPARNFFACRNNYQIFIKRHNLNNSYHEIDKRGIMISLKNSRMGKLDPQLSAYKAKVLLGVSMYTWLVFKLHTILYARERRLSRHFESVWYNIRKSGNIWVGNFYRTWTQNAFLRGLFLNCFTSSFDRS